jgi:DNA replication and repair protein RecF
MALLRLRVSHVRNIRALHLDQLAKVNVISGHNGSGKTSLLEAIHLLGLARSFRNQATRALISYEAPLATVFAEVERPHGGRLRVGVERQRNGESRLLLNGRPAQGLAELAEAVPLQVIDAQSFELIAGPPLGRRQYLDWGVFHVEHAFYRQWLDCQRALKQRNQLLRTLSRRALSDPTLKIWTERFASSAAVVQASRAAYFAKLLPRYREVASFLSPSLINSELRLRSGWPAGRDLSELLLEQAAVDADRGFTQFGPQRADLRLLNDERSAAETLSRGQQKLMATAMKLAQGGLLADLAGRECIYLIDDLPAELDSVHTGRVCQVLASMRAQVFITCVSPEDIISVWPKEHVHALQVFHVEHGSVSRIQ